MRFLIIGILLFNMSVVFSQSRENAFELNKKLGRGINYGNMFEAPTETAWGNQWQPEYAGMISELGFNHIRIPIRWEPADRSLENSPYTINTTFLNRIKQVVDSTLNNDLYAIINMHHHEGLYENPDQQKERFLAQWKQISEFFADYPNKLLFEILNEPHNNLSAEKWNTFLADALNTIREDNADRIVLIGTAEYGGLGGLSKLQIPDDENIILTVHYYNPFHFTHQGAEWSDGSDEWLGTKWTDTETERSVIQNDFAVLKTFEKTNQVPVHIGEFGAYSKADIISRKKWITYMARYLESLNWSWAYWEFSAGFGIYDRDKHSYNQELVDALLHNKMPEPARYVGTPVYSSNFSETIADWNLQTHTSSATANQKNDNLFIAITAGGSEAWHVQLTKNNVQIKAGKKYRLTFKAKASASRSITSYVGKSSSPWSAYSGYNSISIDETFAIYSYIFDANVTDNTARITFDLGQSYNDLTFEYILLEEVVLEQATSYNDLKNVKSKIYPNPITKQLFIDNQDDFQKLTILDIHGAIVKTQQLHHYQNTTNLSKLSSGIYFVLLSNLNNKFTSRIIKN